VAISPSLETKIKGLADEPGVYLMKDAAGAILYVGKAKSLRSRVASYFQDSKDKSPKTQLLVRKIVDLEVVLTDTEVEALVLECNLIKKYRPRFNVSLKDDKSYPYVRLDLNHPFPRLEYVRKVRKDGARYFGPYVAAAQIKDVLRWAQKTFRLRDCSDNEFRNRARPCILHQMGQCSAPCVGLISEEQYGANVQRALKLLDGKTDEVVGELKSEMEGAAGREEYELAAELRDRIAKIEEVSQRQKITDPEADFDRDVVHYARASDGLRAVVVLMAVREGRTVGVFQFPFDDIDPAMPDDELVFGFLAQYYVGRYQSTPELLPKEVLMPEIRKPESVADVGEQAKLLSRALAKRVDFRVPKRGELAHLVLMVRKTAEQHLAELAANIVSTAEDLADVQRKLDLRRFPHRIECYDISHFQGAGTVASRIVFIDGKPDKQLYRHYHVREVEGVDDFRSLREVLERRFLKATHGQGNETPDALPDLVVIDGGRGQLAQAIAIFEELGIIIGEGGVELVSLAKARTERDFKEAEVAGTMERIFKPNQKNPIALKPGTGAHRVLTRARDESHRFAITFHRSVRDKRSLRTR
jgi:excinuclease ABC subunit C